MDIGITSKTDERYTVRQANTQHRIRGQDIVCRAVDQDLLNQDTDPAFQVNPDSDPTRIQGFDDQKLKKENTANFKKSFLIKNCNLLKSQLQEKPSTLKREHPVLQK
jgi:hypothetical protein